MKPFAVFDIDGTLIRWQLYHAVVDRMAKDNLLGKNAHQTLHEARMVWKRREHPEAFREYEKSIIKVYEQALPNISTAKFDAVAAEVASEYKTQVYTYTRRLAADLKHKGYLLFAISGSHEELLKYVADQYGFDDSIGTTYERKDGGFTGNKFIGSHDKKRSLETLIKRNNATRLASVGLGDSKSDAAFLESVDTAIAFNPDRELFEIAKQHDWKIVIERKNMVYELESEDGTYILA